MTSNTKVRVCRFFQRNGECRYGNSCRFVHQSSQRLSGFPNPKQIISSKVLVYKSALCIIPPKSIWPTIQKIREINDAAYVRWPPHMNILYPFVSESRFVSQIRYISRALENVKSFEIVLKQFNYFDNRNQSKLYVYLEPSPTNAVGKLQQVFDALTALYPACVTNKNRHGFKCHLTCGQFDKYNVRSQVRAMNGKWKTLRFTCKSVKLISRFGNQPFDEKHEIFFGKASKQTIPTTVAW